MYVQTQMTVPDANRGFDRGQVKTSVVSLVRNFIRYLLGKHGRILGHVAVN